MVAYLQKPEGSEAFHKIVNFLNSSYIKYALIENPKIYISLIQQFWGTTTARTTDDGEVEITASIDGQVKTITEASLRRHLKLEDSDGITSLPNTEIFEQLALMGYVSDSARLTFQKGHFSPQWRFFIHTILHCLSPKTTAWEQFSSNIATAIICLATNRTFNFSKMIFDAMVKNLDSTHKFLMYPRFLQICLNKQKRLLQPHTRTYPTPTLTQKLFSNMKRVSKGYSGNDAAFTSVDVGAGGLPILKKNDIGLDAGQGKSVKDEDVEEDSSKQGRMILMKIVKLLQSHWYIPLSKTWIYDFDVSIAEGYYYWLVVLLSTVGIKKSKKQLEQEDLGHEEAIYHEVQNRDLSLKLKDFEIEKDSDEETGFDFQLSLAKIDQRRFLMMDNAKETELEDGAEKKVLSASMDVVLRDDIAIDAESLVLNTQKLTGRQLKCFDDFDRQDCVGFYTDWYKKRDEIWKNQQCNLQLDTLQIIRLCGIHMLLMHQELLMLFTSIDREEISGLLKKCFHRMLSRRIEVDQEREMHLNFLSLYGLNFKQLEECFVCVVSSQKGLIQELDDLKLQEVTTVEEIKRCFVMME
ncbi:hypothetical protein Tco_1119795 [Tanacetum coccineum]